MRKIVKPKKNTAILLAAAAILVIAVIVVVIAVVSSGTGGNSEDQVTGTDTQDTVDAVPTEKIATPYGELKYPSQWKDQMTYEEVSADGIVSYAFYALIGENRYELYTAHFGQTDRGNLLGFVPHEGTDIPVYIECHTMKETGDLTDNEMRLFYSMIEGVNELAQSISAMSGFYKP